MLLAVVAHAVGLVGFLLVAWFGYKRGESLFQQGVMTRKPILRGLLVIGVVVLTIIEGLLINVNQMGHFDKLPIFNLGYNLFLLALSAVGAYLTGIAFNWVIRH